MNELVGIGTLIETCKKIAIEAHKGQKRKMGADKGKDYIVHPCRVAARFDGYTLTFGGDHEKEIDSGEFGYWEILTAIGWLHDVVEDTDVTLGDLMALGLPVEVLYGVKGMTKVEGENYLEFVLRAKANPYAKLVKIADIEDNMQSLEEGRLKEKYRMAMYILNLP